MVSNRIIRQRNAEFVRVERAKQESAKTLQQKEVKINPASLTVDEVRERILPMFLGTEEVTFPPSLATLETSIVFRETKKAPVKREDLINLQKLLPKPGTEVSITLTNNEPIMTGILLEVDFELSRLPLDKLTQLSKDGILPISDEDKGDFTITIQGPESKRKFSSYDFPFVVSW